MALPSFLFSTFPLVSVWVHLVRTTPIALFAMSANSFMLSCQTARCPLADRKTIPPSHLFRPNYYIRHLTVTLRPSCQNSTLQFVRWMRNLIRYISITYIIKCNLFNTEQRQNIYSCPTLPFRTELYSNAKCRKCDCENAQWSRFSRPLSSCGPFPAEVETARDYLSTEPDGILDKHSSKLLAVNKIKTALIHSTKIASSCLNRHLVNQQSNINYI